MVARLLLICALLAAASAQIPTSQFYSYGPAASDTLLAPGDDTFALVSLDFPFTFFGQTYSDINVNVNGAVSFGFGLAQFTPDCAGTNNPMIAPFWADIDTRAAGNIYYRETQDFMLRVQFAGEILAHFNTLVYPPQIVSLFIVTWENVPFYNCNGDPNPPSGPRNTFQLIMAALGNGKSYTMFLYNNIQWTTGGVSGGDCVTGLGGTPAKAGFDQGDQSIFFGLPGSCTSSVVDIETTTNTNQPGKWMFKVDQSFQQACPNNQNSIATILQLFGNLLTGGSTTC